MVHTLQTLHAALLQLITLACLLAATAAQQQHISRSHARAGCACVSVPWPCENMLLHPGQRSCAKAVVTGCSAPTFCVSLLCPARSLYNNIKAPSQLQPMATYYLFKDGIEPKWEDPKNTHGGSWNCTAPRGPNGKQVLDSWWLHSVSVLGAQHAP